MPKYKTPWKTNSKNNDFWDEVLVGRSIAKINFDQHGIEGFELDNGETIFLSGHGNTCCRLFIKVNELPGEGS